jgi:GntR family colanic acid and biofilm gene transcriptional regulator
MRSDPGFERINSRTLRNAVYEQLRERISLRSIASQLGVSISPVRDAVWQLESEKVLVVESNKSIRVNSLDAEEMQEALRIRLLLETQAAETACELRCEEDLPRIQSLLKSLNAAINRPKRYVEMNSKYHFAIYSCAHSPMLLGILNGLWARIVPYFFLYVSSPEDLKKTISFHNAMYEALAAREKSKIVDALHRDLETAAALIIPILRQLRS